MEDKNMTKKETIRAYKDFCAHLRNEVHELKDKLKKAEEEAQSNYNDMLDTRLENYDLICKIKKLEVEIATLKSQKGSIFTDPEKCRNKPTEGVSV